MCPAPCNLKLTCNTCSSAASDDEPSAPKVKPPGNAELLTDMDVAACAGLVADPTAVVPPWLDSSWVQDIREIQVKAEPG